MAVKANALVSYRILLDANTFTVVDDQGKRLHDGQHYELYVGTMQPDERSKELTGKESVIISVTR